MENKQEESTESTSNVPQEASNPPVLNQSFYEGLVRYQDGHKMGKVKGKNLSLRRAKGYTETVATSELLKRVRTTSGYTKDEVRDVYNHLIHHIRLILASRGVVKLNGLGTIKTNLFKGMVRKQPSGIVDYCPPRLHFRIVMETSYQRYVIDRCVRSQEHFLQHEANMKKYVREINEHNGFRLETNAIGQKRYKLRRLPDAATSDDYLIRLLDYCRTVRPKFDNGKQIGDDGQFYGFTFDSIKKSILDYAKKEEEMKNLVEKEQDAE